MKHFIISLMTMIKIIKIILGIWSSSHLTSNNLFDGQHHLSTPVWCHPRWEVKIANTGFLLNFQQKFRTFYLNLLTLCLVHFCNFTQVLSDECWKKKDIFDLTSYWNSDLLLRQESDCKSFCTRHCGCSGKILHHHYYHNSLIVFYTKTHTNLGKIKFFLCHFS